MFRLRIGVHSPCLIIIIKQQQRGRGADGMNTLSRTITFAGFSKVRVPTIKKQISDPYAGIGGRRYHRHAPASADGANQLHRQI